MRRFTGIDLALAVAVFGAAFGARAVMLYRQDTAVAQWPDAAVVAFAKHLAGGDGFRGPVALQDPERQGPSAALSPGYPYFVAAMYAAVDFATVSESSQQRDGRVLRLAMWVQCFLGAATAVLVYLIGWSLFESRTVAVLGGLLAAGHYLWVIAARELADGVLASCLLAWCICLGLPLVRRGGVAGAFGFGAGLGLLALTRASLLPAVLIAALWGVWKLRTRLRGWQYSLTVLVAFALTLLPWTWRNWRAFGQVVPVTTRAGLDFWWGNNLDATGGIVPRQVAGEPIITDMVEGAAVLINPNSDRGSRLQNKSEPERFASLLREAAGWAGENRRRFIELRLRAAVYYLTGQRMWFDDVDAHDDAAPAIAEPPLLDDLEVAPPVDMELPPPQDGDAPPPPSEQEQQETDSTGQSGAVLPSQDPCAPWMVVILVAGGLAGMRWSHRWRRRQGLLTIFLVSGPLPVILGHAGLLHGPRLPLDTVLIVYTAFALGCLVPGLSGRLRGGPGADAG